MKAYTLTGYGDASKAQMREVERLDARHVNQRQNVFYLVLMLISTLTAISVIQLSASSTYMVEKVCIQF